MPCYKPLEGWINAKTKKFSISAQDAFRDLPQSVSCGQCLGCKIEKSKMWGARIMHEAKMHDENAFVTLTYDDDHIPENGTLVKEHTQLFWKLLRQKLEPQKIRYYLCGEYGDETYRPHYHAILFGYWPKQEHLKKRPDSRSGHSLWEDTFLRDIWGKGYVVVADVNFDTAQYVSGYVTKKITGPMANDHYKGRLPEFSTMSRKPGIGSTYYEKFKSDLINHDNIIVNGHECTVPRYYNEKTKKEDAELYKNIQAKRRQNIRELSDEQLTANYTIRKQNLNRFKKGVL